MRAVAPKDIPSLLARLAQRGDGPALTFYRGKALIGRMTYGELLAKIESLAGALHDAFGVRVGDRVAILAPNRLEVPVLVLALLRLGAVVVPLNPGASPEDWRYILDHSEALGLCATREHAAKVQPAATRTFTLHIEDLFTLSGPMIGALTGLDEETAIVLYTSGTTGKPKGVALRQRNILANAWSMATNFHLDGTTQLAVLPLYHAHAFGFGLMTALSTGGHLVFTERPEPFTWAEVVRTESVTVSSVVPTLLPLLLASGVTRAKVPSLQHLLVSSAPLPAELARDFESRTAIPIVQGWGLSEYTNFACCVSPEAPADEHAQLMFGWDVPSIGPALEGTEVRVVDEAGMVVGEAVRGELVVRGHSTMSGYFRDPASTARTLDAEGWLRTGDEGCFRLHAGRPVFFITGRIKEIIIRDADKYSPIRIESVLVKAFPELSGQLVVLGFPHQAHGEEVGLYVEIEAFGADLQERLTTAIQSLPMAERPKVLLHGARPIPRTHTGKIQRRKMQRWFAAFEAHRGPLVVEALGPGATVSS